MGISAVALLWAFGSKLNLWQETEYVLFWFPVGLSLIGAVGLRLHDFNFPIWKTLFKSLLSPALSGLGGSLRSFVPFP